MHCRARDYTEYQEILNAGFSKAIAYSVVACQVLGWSELKDRNRLEVIRYRKPSPMQCPHCGRIPVQLFNKSGRYRDDDTDYEYFCRECYEESRRPARSFVKPGDKLKPWSDLKRRAKVSRIRRALPRPGHCQHCDKTELELVSRSGTWLEDLTDYAWVCRHHAYMIEALRPEPKPIIIEPWDPALFPHWYNVTMPGTFEGHSILDRNSAGGRFLAFEPPSLKKHLRS
jgi:hypothetical protein